MLAWRLRPFYPGAGVDFRGALTWMTNLSPAVAAPPRKVFANNSNTSRLGIMNSWHCRAPSSPGAQAVLEEPSRAQSLLPHSTNPTGTGLPSSQGGLFPLRLSGCAHCSVEIDARNVIWTCTCPAQRALPSWDLLGRLVYTQLFAPFKSCPADGEVWVDVECIFHIMPVGR